jgi:hypothetical protein
MPLLGRTILNDRIRFDHNEPFGIDERRDLHDRVHGPDVLEVFAPDFSHCLPILNPFSRAATRTAPRRDFHDGRKKLHRAHDRRGNSAAEAPSSASLPSEGEGGHFFAG